MKYYITIRYKDGTVSQDHTYDYGRTAAKVLADAKKTYPHASSVSVSTSNPESRQRNPLPKRRKRRGSWPRGKTPPHLKKYLFK